MTLLRKNMAAGPWYWLRSDLEHWLRSLRPPEGKGYPLRHERGWGWTIRSTHGWRRFPVVTPPLHHTRSITAGGEDAAMDWGLERMGMDA